MMDRWGFVPISSVCPASSGYFLVQENYQVPLAQHLHSKQCEPLLWETESLRARHSLKATDLTQCGVTEDRVLCPQLNKAARVLQLSVELMPY